MEFNRKMKEACAVRNNLLQQDKRVFESLPNYYKTGLHCHEVFRNIRLQSFELRKKAFYVIKITALRLLAEEKYEEAEYKFQRVRFPDYAQSIAVFKYIENVNKNWRNEGIKDEDLRYIDDLGSNEEEANDVKDMILASLLNISLCLLKQGKYNDLTQCCDDIISRDPSNIKGQYNLQVTLVIVELNPILITHLLVKSI